jgi:small-conductance mechanosensitive channel
MKSDFISLILKAVMPFGIIILFLLMGFLLQRFVSDRLHKLAQKTTKKGDDVLIRSLKRLIFAAFLLIGLAVALKTIAFPPQISRFPEKIITLGAIFFVVLFAVGISRGFFDLYAERITGVSTTIFKNIVSIIVYMIGFLIMLDYLGISITPIITALGVGGLAIALALQDTLSNLFSGLHILMTKKIRPGDYVKLDSGDEGYVVDITWRNTTIRALANNIIVVPNKKLVESIIVNFNLPEREMAVLVPVSVSYDTNLQKAEKVILEVAKDAMRSIPGAVAEFEPFIRYNLFGDSGIQCTVILRAKEFVNQYLIKHEFIKQLHARFKKEGIEIPFPARKVYFQKE